MSLAESYTLIQARYPQNDWNIYIDQVEAAIGRAVANGHAVDALYALYMKDVPVERAIQSIEGLERAGRTVARVMADIKETRAMRKPEDSIDRFHASAEPPRPGLIRMLPKRAHLPLLVAWLVLCTCSGILAAVAISAWVHR